MKITKIETIHHDNPIPVYDVINAGELHNFIIHTDNSDIVSHNCAMIDECNFARAGVKDISISKNHMKHLYNTANARITGTFKLEGRIYGKMFTCSSKNTDNDYLSEHIEQQLDAGNTHLYLFDKPQWEVLPSYRFGKEKFYITVGDRFKRGFVVPEENSDEAHLEEYKEQGYKVLEVPADYKPNFKADYDIALRDIAGISVVGAMGFITQEMITPNVSEDRVNPFFQDYYEIGLRDNITIEQYFHTEVIPNNLKVLPMNIHIDFAEVSDHIGISGVVIDGNKNVLDLKTEKKVMMPFFRQIFQVAIGSPRGDRMSFQKVINFILWLKRNGFNIGIVSTDQYQSAYVRENLEHQGFTTEKISVDRSIDPYISLRNLLQDQRLELVKCDLQEIEMINLQRNNDRIDHKPQTGCFTEDTKISLVDGRTLSINELLIEQKYKTNWVYTINESTGLIEAKPILNIFQTKLTKDLIKITLDNDEVIYCTPDHRFMLRDGSYEEAQNLLPEDSLMPLYTKISNKGIPGYRMYYDPNTDQWHYEHRQFCLDPQLTEERGVVHHCNYNKLDNTPTNLKRVTNSKHRQIHNNYTQDYNKISQGVAKWHAANKNSDNYLLRSCKNLITRHYKETGEELSIEEAKYEVALSKQAKINKNIRLRDIELLFDVSCKNISGKTRTVLGRKLRTIIDDVQKEFNINWYDLNDTEKISYYNKLIDIKEDARILKTMTREITLSIDKVITKYRNLSKASKQSNRKSNNLLRRSPKKKGAKKSSHITTTSTFSPKDVEISWIESLFGIDWDTSSKGERYLAKRRFNRLLEYGEYIPLEECTSKYIPRKAHIIKSIDLFGSDKDINCKNIEEYCGIHMEDIDKRKRAGYSRIYNNFCKGHICKENMLKKRIHEIELLYNVRWSDLDTAGKSKYSTMYHNLINAEDKLNHYSAISNSISRHTWYTNGIDNKYLLDTEEIPKGYYKGRVRSQESIEKGRITIANRSIEEKAKISEWHRKDTSNRIWVTNGSIDKYIIKDTPIPEGFRLGRCKVGKNHKVKSIERISRPCRVYDLTIKDNHNFALAAGVFVHNSSEGVPCLANGYNSKGIGKDCADALCGACSSLIAHLDLIKPPPKSVINAITSVNTGRMPSRYGTGVKQPLPGFGSQYRKFN